MKKKTILIVIIIFFNVKTDSGIIYSLGEQDSWIRSWGSSQYNWCMGMCIDSSDYICITVKNDRGNQYLLKYDTAGNLIWDQYLYNNPNWSVRAIDTDSFNNIYIVGITNLYCDEESDIFLQKYDSLGNLLWNSTWNGENDDFCSAIAIDSLNNLYVVGGTNGIDWWKFDMLFLKFNSSGGLMFNYSWGSNLDESCQGLTIDSSDNLYLCCYSYDHSLNKGESTLIKCDTSGKFERNQTIIGGTYTCIIDYLDNVIVSATHDTLAWSEFSPFILKYSNSGTLLWNTSLEGKIRSCEDIAIDSQNNIYLVGSHIGGCCNWLGICSTCYYMILGVYNSSGQLEYEQKCYRISSYGEAIAFDSSGNLYLAGEIYPDTGKIVLLKNPSEYIENDLTFLYIFILIGIFCTIICIFIILKQKKKKKKRIIEKNG